MKRILFAVIITALAIGPAITQETCRGVITMWTNENRATRLRSLESAVGCYPGPCSREFSDDLLVELPHGVDSEVAEIEVDRLYPEFTHGAQVVDDLGVCCRRT
jgi:hypothetical protein